MRRIFFLTSMMALACPCPGWAQSLEPAPWYVGGHVGVVSVDDDAGSADDGTILRGNIGRQLNDELTVELEVSGGEVDFAGQPSLDQSNVALNLMIVNREPSWNPYFLAGFGGIDHDRPDFSDTGAMAQVGIGGMWDLNGYGLMLRADLRYRHADLDVKLIDAGQVLFTVGLEFPFGRH